MTISPAHDRDLIERLEERATANGSAPLISYYDQAQGHRTELSGRTFANWVDKSANLLFSLGIGENPRVAVTLLDTDPGHWVGLIWALATWQVGGRVVVDALNDALVEAAIVGPEDPHPIPGVETIACSLHPLGAGFQTVTAGVTDYAEVLAQPDAHWRAEASDPVCFSAAQQITWQEMNAVAGPAERLLVVPGDDPWQNLVECIITPIMTGGSVVVVRGADPAQLSGIASQERADVRSVKDDG